jgi:DNA invertase Pin-like site-specific DNA recombinase
MKTPTRYQGKVRKSSCREAAYLSLEIKMATGSPIPGVAGQVLPEFANERDLRTSTDDQKLGIDAQRDTIQRIAVYRKAEVVRAFTEHESGGNNERPELDKAIRHARRVGGIVCVAKLDRLARDASFLMRLYDGNVPLIFGDLPEIDGSAASRMMVQVMAAVAEFERRRTGERMRDWWKQRKALSLPAGCPRNMTSEGRAKGVRNAAIKRTQQAIEELADIAEIASKVARGGSTLAEIAAHLNAEGYVTRKGAKWHPIQVKRVLDRLKPA